MKYLVKVIVFCLCFVCLSACSRITQENFDKIQTGMPMSTVVSILGEPSDSQSVNIAGFSGTSATWKYRNSVITIQFLNDKVQVKSFSKTTQDTDNNHDQESTPAG